MVFLSSDRIQRRSADPLRASAVRAQSLRSDRAGPDGRRAGADRPRRAADEPARHRAEVEPGGARSPAPARIRAAHHAAHVRGDRRLAAVHLRGRHPRRQEPQGRAGDHAGARHPAVGAGARLPDLHRHLLHGPVPVQRTGGGVRRDLHRLHRPGLEHGLQLLPVAAHPAEGPRRGQPTSSASPPGSASSSWSCRSPRPPWCGTR